MSTNQTGNGVLNNAVHRTTRLLRLLKDDTNEIQTSKSLPN
jgi:hypothetical protein